MVNKRIHKKWEKMNRNFTKRLITDNVKKIPIFESMVNAVEDTETQVQKEEEINKMDSICHQIEHIKKIAPSLDPCHTIKKLDTLLSSVNDEINNNPDFHIKLNTDNSGVREIKVIPKNETLKVRTKLNLNKDKLDGKTNFIEFLNDKIKKGESITFKNDEIEEVLFSNNQLDDFKNSKQLTIKPQILDKPIICDFIIENSDIAYNGIEIAPIYRDGNEGTLVSLNLPFRILMNIKRNNPDSPFRFDNISEEISVLELNKLHNFILEMMAGKTIICKDSKRGNVFFTLKNPKGFSLNPSDRDSFKIIEMLARIDKKFYLDFISPKTVSENDIQMIWTLNQLIDKKTSCININNISLKISSEVLKNLLDYYCETGYLENFKMQILNYKIPLIDKIITLEKVLISINRAKIKEDINYLKQCLSNKDVVVNIYVPEEGEAKLSYIEESKIPTSSQPQNLN